MKAFRVARVTDRHDGSVHVRGARSRCCARVEQIRREVASLTAAELHRRVPDPPGDDEIGRLARTRNEMLDRLEHAQDPAAPVRLRRLP